MKTTLNQLINKPLFRPLFLVFTFVIITATLDMFWKTASRKSGKVGFEVDDEAGMRRDKLVMAHFMVSSLCYRPLRLMSSNSFPYRPVGEYLPVSRIRLAGEFQVGRGDRHVSLPALHNGSSLLIACHTVAMRSL
jgi:hypothetical protein